MHPLTVSRILFILLWVNEAMVLYRSTAEERGQAVLPRYAPLTFLLSTLPMFIALDLPLWLGWTAAGLQATGLLLEISGEIQLTRANSFSIVPKVPPQFISGGLYRVLENPVYVGALLQYLAFAIWMPLAYIGVYFLAELLRKMVAAERAQLATANFTHRRFDSFIWN